MALYVPPAANSVAALSSGDLLYAVLNEVYGQVQLPIKLVSKKRRRDLDAVVLAKSFLDVVSAAARDAIATRSSTAIAAMVHRNRPVVTLNAQGTGYVPRTNWGTVWGLLGPQTRKRGQDAVLTKIICKFVQRWFDNVVQPLRFPTGLRGTGGTATNDRVAAFANAVLARDGYKCPATGGIKFSSVAVGQPRTTIEVAHIIPHHLKKNDNVTRRVAAAFQLFGGIATNIQNDIDQQCNGIPMDICLHRSFDRLEWSIEVLAGVYYLRFVRYPTASPAIGVASQVVQRNMILTFGGNNNEKPKAELCNVHHAICRFVHMVGMADIFDEIEDDDDEYVDGVPSLKLVIEGDGTEMELEDEDEEEVNKVEIGDDGDIPYVKPSVSTGGNDRNVRFLKEGYPRETVLVN